MCSVLFESSYNPCNDFSCATCPSSSRLLPAEGDAPSLTGDEGGAPFLGWRGWRGPSVHEPFGGASSTRGPGGHQLAQFTSIHSNPFCCLFSVRLPQFQPYHRAPSFSTRFLFPGVSPLLGPVQNAEVSEPAHRVDRPCDVRSGIATNGARTLLASPGLTTRPVARS